MEKRDSWMQSLIVVVTGLVIVVVGLLAVLVPIAYIKLDQFSGLMAFGKKIKEDGPKPLPVATAIASNEQWENMLEFPGTLRATQGVTLTAEMPGRVVNIPVENGAEVKKGDILIELDTTQERADLDAVEANLKLAKINFDRMSDLMQKRVISQSEFDSATALYTQLTAQQATLKAVIAKKIICAPFNGRVGIRHINLGQTLRVGDELIPLYTDDPIFVEFSVPQRLIGEIEVGQKLRLRTNGAEKPVEGTITAINPVTDDATRTTVVQGTIRNPDGIFSAGQFVQVDVILPSKLNVLAIPATSVLKATYGDSVFVVEPKKDEDGNIVKDANDNELFVARQQIVECGIRRGDYITVIQGLEAGARVVSAGAFKLTNGATVTINDEMQPETSLNPTPDNS